MHTRQSWLAKFSKWYEKAKRWIVYVNLTIIMVLLYLGDFLGPLRNALLPAAIISTLAILFEILQKLEERTSSNNFKEYSSFVDGMPELLNVLSQDKDETLVEMITGPGGTSFSALLSAIINSSRARKVCLTLHLINPNGSLSPHCPQHWLREAQLTIDRIKAGMGDKRITIKVYTYDNLPVIRGVMINKKCLLLGFFTWMRVASQFELRGSEFPHIFLSREYTANKYFFDLFENWLNHSPTQLEYKYP